MPNYEVSVVICHTDILLATLFILDQARTQLLLHALSLLPILRFRSCRILGGGGGKTGD